MTLRTKNTYTDKRKRKLLQKNEIFFECCSLLDQSQFSNQLDFFLFKRRNNFSYTSKFRNRCLVSGYEKSVFSRFKVSRHALLKKALSGSVTGFYRAIW